MNRQILLAMALAATAAGVTYAAEGSLARHRMVQPQTRADAQAKVRAMFQRTDANHDGSVTRAEFDAGRQAKLAEWQAKDDARDSSSFEMMDADHNGQLSKAEFAAARAKGGLGMGRHRRTLSGGGWFDRVDANHDGKVTMAEAESSAMALFDAADTNHDGTVTPEERRAAWPSMRAMSKR